MVDEGDWVKVYIDMKGNVFPSVDWLGKWVVKRQPQATRAFYKYLVPPKTESQTTGPLQSHPSKLRRSSLWIKSMRKWYLKDPWDLQTRRLPVLISSGSDLQGGNWGTEGCCFLTSEITLVKHGTDKEVIMVPIGWLLELRILSHFGTQDRKRKHLIHLGGFEC